MDDIFSIREIALGSMRHEVRELTKTAHEVADAALASLLESVRGRD
jgi:hypothetical protein